MNKRLEAIIDRVLTWPEAAQAEAERALDAIEKKHVRREFTPEEEAKLAALRDTINRSIELGGSFTDEEVESLSRQRRCTRDRERGALIGQRLRYSTAARKADLDDL